MPSTRPRRPDMSLLMSPTLPLGTVMCSVTIGSNSAWLGLLEHVAKGHRAGRLEGRFRAVDIVILAEMHFDADVLHLVAGNHAALQPLHKSLFHRRQKVVGNRAADDRIDPQKIVLVVVMKFAACAGSVPWWRTPSGSCLSGRETCGCALRRTGRGRPIAFCAGNCPRPSAAPFRDREFSARACRLPLCRAA